MTNDLKQPLKAKFIQIKPRHWTSCPCVLHQKKIQYSCGRAIQSETKGIHSTRLIPHPCHRLSVEYRSWHIRMAHFNPVVAGQVFRYTWCTPGSLRLSDNVSKSWHVPFKHEWNHPEVWLLICSNCPMWQNVHHRLLLRLYICRTSCFTSWHFRLILVMQTRTQ